MVRPCVGHIAHIQISGFCVVGEIDRDSRAYLFYMSIICCPIVFPGINSISSLRSLKTHTGKILSRRDQCVKNIFYWKLNLIHLKAWENTETVICMSVYSVKSSILYSYLFTYLLTLFLSINSPQKFATGHHHRDPFGYCVLCVGQHCLLHCYDPHWAPVVSSCCCGEGDWTWSWRRWEPWGFKNSLW